MSEWSRLLRVVRVAVRAPVLLHAGLVQVPPTVGQRVAGLPLEATGTSDQYVSSYSSTTWKVHRPSMTLRPTRSCSIRSASSVCPASRSRSHALAQLQVGAPGELVEAVEVPAGPLGGLERLADLADRLDGLVVHAGSSRMTPTAARLRHLRAGLCYEWTGSSLAARTHGADHSGRSRG